MGVFRSLMPLIKLGSMSKRGLVRGRRLGWLVTNDPVGSLKTLKAAVPTILKWSSDICYEKIKEIPCISCPSKPDVSIALIVKLNISMLKGIRDDIVFCFKLVREESVIIFPGDSYIRHLTDEYLQ
ncbi:zinc-finger protein [Orobanche gracilis]